VYTDSVGLHTYQDIQMLSSELLMRNYVYMFNSFIYMIGNEIS